MTEIPFEWPAFLAGAIGGTLFETSRWTAFRTARQLPFYFRKIHFWALTLVMIGTGGLLAAVLMPESWTQAVFVGISAPAIISRIAALMPAKLELGAPPKVGGPPPNAGLRDWLKG